MSFTSDVITGLRNAAANSAERVRAFTKGPAEANDEMRVGDGADHWLVMRGLLPFVWPEGRADLRRNVVLACIVMVLAKVVTVLVPIAFKNATDLLNAQSTQGGAAGTVQTMALVATMLILAYGAGRIAMMVLNQLRDVLFTRCLLYTSPSPRDPD